MLVVCIITESTSTNSEFSCKLTILDQMYFMDYGYLLGSCLATICINVVNY